MTPEENAIRHALKSYDSAPNWRKGFTLNRLHAYCTPAAMTALLSELGSLRKDAESATQLLTDDQVDLLIIENHFYSGYKLKASDRTHLA